MTATLTHPTTTTPVLSYRKAERVVLETYTSDWFRSIYWIENEPRVRRMAELTAHSFPNPGQTRVLDVGCYNGFVSLLFHLMGYQVTGLDDTAPSEEREPVFREHGIDFVTGNLNDVHGLAHIPDQSADVILFGEVFEHLLNAPTETLREFRRILRPNGLLILSTPNPSTVMNAWRVLTDSYLLWGTDEFMRRPKLTNGTLTSYEGIHYHEYPARIVRDELLSVGFTAVGIEYVPPGPAANQSVLKHIAKFVMRVTGLDRTRLLCSRYVLSARVP